MLAPCLALLAVLTGSPPPSDPSALVEQLGSPRFAERERAASALRELGGVALPALRAARSARDAEVRTRASAILDRIESELMVRPTLVALDFQDRPLAEVVRALGERSRMVLMPEDPENFDAWQGRKIHLESPAPVPFWAAVDRLCDAGKLRYSLGAMPDIAGREQAGLLLSQGRPKLRPASDQGPFRVKLSRIHHSRDRVFDQEDAAPDAPEAETVEEFGLHLEVWAEPRLLIGQAGPLVLSEAADDQGRSLLLTPGMEPDDSDDEGPFDDQNFGQGVVGLQAQLRYPPTPCRQIRRLRGDVPILVAARKEEPLVLPLDQAGGKVHTNGDLRVTVHEFKLERDGEPSTIVLTVRPGTDQAVAPARPSDEGPASPTATVFEQQVEILDEKGRILPWSLMHRETEGDVVRVRLAVPPVEDVGPPAKLRVFGLTRALVRVQFEFKEIPTP